MFRAYGRIEDVAAAGRRQDDVREAHDGNAEAATCQPLGEARRGAVLRVVRIEGDQALKRRLRNMGLMPGRAIEVCERSPAGVVVSAQGMKLALAPEAAQHVMVTRRARDEGRQPWPVAAE